jgi:hypothetical protein
LATEVSRRSERDGRRGGKAYLHPFAWTNIVRHQIVKHEVSPDDPALADYWAWRRRKAPLPINRTALRLHKVQDGRCAICRATLIAVADRPQTPREWKCGWRPPGRRSMSSGTNAARTRLNPVSFASTAITAKRCGRGGPADGRAARDDPRVAYSRVSPPMPLGALPADAVDIERLKRTARSARDAVEAAIERPAEVLPSARNVQAVAPAQPRRVERP